MYNYLYNQLKDWPYLKKIIENSDDGFKVKFNDSKQKSHREKYYILIVIPIYMI